MQKIPLFFLLFLALLAAASPASALEKDSTSVKDSIWRDPGRFEEKPDSTKAVSYVKRDYDHKQQVIVGSVVMLCIALAMVGMNNYNPRR